MQPEQVLQQQLDIFGDLLPSYSNSRDHQTGATSSGMEVDADGTASDKAGGRDDGEQRLDQDQKLSGRRQGKGQGQREERSAGGQGRFRR